MPNKALDNFLYFITAVFNQLEEFIYKITKV